MNQDRTLDSLRVHASAGTLASQISKRDRPAEPAVALPVPIRKPVVYLQWPFPNLDTPAQRSILLAKAYSEFFGAPLEILSPERMMAAIASMLTNILDPNQVSRDGELETACLNAGMILERIEYRTPEDIHNLFEDPKVQAFLRTFPDQTRGLYSQKRDQQLVCVGIILLTMGKNVNPQNYDGWVKNRLRTFEGALGIMPDKCCWTAAQVPSQEALATSYAFLSASFSLRRLFFLICVAGTRGADRISGLFREVVMFLQGVEMGHIVMIDKYIFSKYPELLRIRSIRDNMDAMNNAWAFLASLTPGERYFVKILYNKDETAPLNRNNFQLLATAAIAAAQFETPSMRFYQGGNVTATSGSIVETVRQYLSLRMNLSYFSIMQSPFAYMTEAEKERYLAQAEALAQGGTLLELQEVPRQAAPGRIPAPPQ
ncbi:VP5 [Cat Tien Hospitalitermes Lispi-like virus]|uniref:VP5 n=1 Tax=Cat Tien Hospitalitermes Lispi-like virus TaxID=2952743 RepID=A0AAE9NJI8_9MONO|nr:VP5 [Cat Tien Hospitalitermes Lispi-like virus]